MIYIFTESSDILSNFVTKELALLSHPFLRINLDEFYIGFDFELKKMKKSGLRILYNNVEYDIAKNDSIWFRRGNISTYIFFNNKRHLIFQDYIHNEKKALESFIIKFLKKYCYCLGNPLVFDLNKLDMLNIARKAHFLIPDTYVTYKKDSLLNFSKDTIVCKPFSDCLLLSREDEVYQTYVEMTKTEDIEENFGNSLFQKRIIPSLEIRVLSFGNNFFCSQLQRTVNEHIDMRHHTNSSYKYQRHELTDFIKRKILKFHKILNCNFSVIDFLIDDKGKYYLIDFNPCGQYDEIKELYSEIDKKIAVLLINKEL
jgi:hypothetical protein